MELSENEFLSLYGELRDRDAKIIALNERNAMLENELSSSRRECDAWQTKAKVMEAEQTKLGLENTLLRNVLMLSWSKIKLFVSHVSDIKMVAFLQTFMQKTASDDLQPTALETINRLVELPERMTNVTNNNYNAPIGQHVAFAERVEVNNVSEEVPYE